MKKPYLLVHYSLLLPYLHVDLMILTVEVQQNRVKNQAVMNCLPLPTLPILRRLIRITTASLPLQLF